MTKEETPYIGRCDFCSQGLLRFMLCGECNKVCAVCDECELIWHNIAAVSDDGKTKSSTSFPTCPTCKKKVNDWKRLDAPEVASAELNSYVAGKSI